MKLAPLFALLAGCAPLLGQADWPTELPAGACTVTVTREDATGTWDLVRVYDAEGHIQGGTTRLAYSGRGREIFDWEAGRLRRVRSYDERDAYDFPCDAEGGCSTPASREVVDTTFTYDEAGRPASRTREDSRYALVDGAYRRQRYEHQRTRWEFEGERLRAIHDDMGTTRFRWEDGRVTRVDREAHYPRHTTVEHDEAGRVIRTRYETCTPDDVCEVSEVTSFRYDAEGRLQRLETVDPREEAHAAPRTTEWAYEGPRLLRRTEVDGTRTHVLEYAYDARGRLIQVTENGSVRARYAYEGRCDAVQDAPEPPTAARELGLETCTPSPGYVLACQG